MFGDSDELTEYEKKVLTHLGTWGMRGLRGTVYFLVALVLISVNTYGIGNTFLLSLVIGVLGVGSSTARIAFVAIGVLLAMAVLPVTAIDALTTAAF